LVATLPSPLNKKCSSIIVHFRNLTPSFLSTTHLHTHTHNHSFPLDGKMNSKYPPYTNDNTTPPTISLRDYDDAEWAETTCVDYKPDSQSYVIVDLDKTDHIVAHIDQNDNKVLDIIFASAKETHSKQQQLQQ